MIGSGATTSGDDGERLVTLNRGDSPATVRYRLRGLDGKVLREYTYSSEGSTWSWDKDYIWRGSQLLGTASSSERRHFHLDHLGSTRLITDDNASVVAEHTYAPFGEEVSTVVDDGEPMKFTGHERDLLGSTGTTAHLDYMHARYYNPHLGRFLSVDPVGGDVGSSQSWNRYGYGLNNPLIFIDPDGNEVIEFGKQKVEIHRGEVLVIGNHEGRATHVATFSHLGQQGQPMGYEHTSARNQDLRDLPSTTRSRGFPDNTGSEHKLVDLTQATVNGKTNPYSPEGGATVLGVVTVKGEVSEGQLDTGVAGSDMYYMSGTTAPQLMQCTDFVLSVASEGGFELQGVEEDDNLLVFRSVGEKTDRVSEE